MSLTRFRARLRLVVESPVISQGLTVAAWGVDAAQARDFSGRVVLPGDMIRGNLKQAFRELGMATDTLFGKGDAARAALVLGDLVAETPGAKGGSLTRVAIDDATGSVKAGALVTVELSHPIGQEVEFAGPLEVVAESEAVLDDIERAAGLITAVGAFKSVGFGVVLSARVERLEATPLVRPQPRQGLAGRVRALLRFDRPLLVDAERVADNVFRGNAVVPGAVLKGALAARLAQMGGTGLDQALSQVVFGHAYPLHGDGTLSHRPLPVSLVTDAGGGTVADLLRALPLDDDRIPLVGEDAPTFRVDWKDDAKVRAALGWPQDVAFPFDTRTRTAVDGASGVSAEAQLFSYSALIPDGREWCVEIDRNGADADAFGLFLAVLEQGLDGIGKTSAHAAVTLGPAPEIPLPDGRDGWAVTLLTAAVLNDQDRLRDGGDLAADYQDYWQDVLPGTRLVNFFATHRLAGGWQAVRARRHDGYRPFLLTEPGSVFLLQGGDPERMRDLLCGNLPVRGGADWRTCSFVPGNGFGAIALDVIDHAEWAKQVRHVH